MRTTLAKAILALTVLAAIAASAASDARAQAQFDARYTLSMAGIAIGKLTWRTQIAATDYATSANGRVTGILSILVRGEGNVSVKGRMKEGRPQPASFVSAVNREDEKTAVQMTFDGSRVRDLKVDEPPHESDRVPIADAHKLGVVDPLTAFLIPGPDDPAAREGCEHNLGIFDGRRRYDLALSFKRTDTIKGDNNKLSTVLVCAVKFMPVSGHRTSSPLVKFLSEGRDIEVWLAPVTGTRILAPVRMAVASLVGNMVLQADQFETTAVASGK
jgi:hypothetical protein